MSREQIALKGFILQKISRLTISRASSWTSFTINIISKRDRIVGIKSIFSSPLVSSHRPNIELAAARTEQREFKVVVIPA